MARPVIEARHKAFLGGRTVAAAMGWVPLLLLYAVIHTTFLRPYEPESRSGQVVMLIVVPFGWFACVTLAYRWLGPRVHKLRCPGCGAGLVDDAFRAVLERGHCPRCDDLLVDESGKR